jgi:hypothetical protein
MYIDLVENNNDKEQWTANLNCQLFVQKLMEHLNLDYPSNILTCSDIPSTIVDISILSFRSSTRSEQKLSSASQANNDHDGDYDDDGLD